MKNLFLLIPLLMGMVACDKDDAARPSGKPNKLTCSNDLAVSFSYEKDRLLRITENGPAGSAASTIRFRYDDQNELSALSFEPTDPNVADGHASLQFQKTEERKITVESSGEPALNLCFVQEIELDANNLPIKITDTGKFSIGPGGIRTKEAEGLYYALFTWDTSAQRLLKEEIYRLETSEAVATYTYGYDSAPGIMSQINCPLWLYTYLNYRNRYALGTYKTLFLGHANNLAEVTLNDHPNNRQEVLKYLYHYSSEGFPVSVSIQTSGQETMTIRIQY
jgi:hypothetical protein